VRFAGPVDQAAQTIIAALKGAMLVAVRTTTQPFSTL